MLDYINMLDPANGPSLINYCIMREWELFIPLWKSYMSYEKNTRSYAFRFGSFQELLLVKLINHFVRINFPREV